MNGLTGLFLVFKAVLGARAAGSTGLLTAGLAAIPAAQSAVAVGYEGLQLFVVFGRIIAGASASVDHTGRAALRGRVVVGNANGRLRTEGLLQTAHLLMLSVLVKATAKGRSALAALAALVGAVAALRTALTEGSLSRALAVGAVALRTALAGLTLRRALTERVTTLRAVSAGRSIVGRAVALRLRTGLCRAGRRLCLGSLSLGGSFRCFCLFGGLRLGRRLSLDLLCPGLLLPGLFLRLCRLHGGGGGLLLGLCGRQLGGDLGHAVQIVLDIGDLVCSGQSFQQEVKFDRLKRALSLDLQTARGENIGQLLALHPQILCYFIYFILRIDCHVSS